MFCAAIGADSCQKDRRPTKLPEQGDQSFGLTANRIVSRFMPQCFIFEKTKL